MKHKLNQKKTRAARQIANHGATKIVIRNFPGRVVWAGTVGELHRSPTVCGIPEPLLLHPGSTKPEVVAQEFIRKSKFATAAD